MIAKILDFPTASPFPAFHAACRRHRAPQRRAHAVRAGRPFASDSLSERDTSLALRKRGSGRPRDSQPLKYSRAALLLRCVITGFAARRTKGLFARERMKGLSAEIQRAALRKLLIIDAAASIDDLRVPPGNRLEALRGDLRGFQSIRVNDQWHIVFRWSEGNASDVRIIDYH